MFLGMVRQPGQRGVHILTTDGEWLAHHLDVPGLAILAACGVEVAEPACNLSGFGRVGNKADVYRSHAAPIPAADPRKRLVSGPLAGQGQGTGYDGDVIPTGADAFVRVRGASEHNLRHVDVDIPRDVMVAFTGVSGSGKSSLAFGTLYAEAQRRYFESVAPYARRLLQQVGAPHVREVSGLPPAVALQQRRGAATPRSSVGTITTLSNLLRVLYSRAGDYPAGAEHLAAEAFSPNTVAGACPRCHGLGVVHDVTEELLVPDPSLSIREGAIAAWPGAWQGANLRSIVTGLGIDVDKPWSRLRKKDRDWLLFTDEQPSVLIKPERDRIDYGYYGKFWSARKHVMHVLADSKSERMRERALRFVEDAPCPECHGSGLRPEALAVRFAGRSIAEVNDLPFAELVELLRPIAGLPEEADDTNEVAVRISADLVARVEVLLDLGLGYLSL